MPGRFPILAEPPERGCPVHEIFPGDSQSDIYGQRDKAGELHAAAEGENPPVFSGGRTGHEIAVYDLAKNIKKAGNAGKLPGGSAAPVFSHLRGQSPVMIFALYTKNVTGSLNQRNRLKNKNSVLNFSRLIEKAGRFHGTVYPK
jgi:hypothetical protein